jgi:adenine phosphoribosyltransferase
MMSRERVQGLTRYDTGGSAAAAGSLVKKLGATLIGYVFMLELDFLKGRDKLDAPVYTLLSSQEK